MMPTRSVGPKFSSTALVSASLARSADTNCSMWYSSQKIRNVRTSSRAASAAACEAPRIGSDRSSVGWPFADTNLNDVIGCGLPSSSISKSSAVSVVTGLPLRSVTVASTLMTLVPDRNGGRWGSCAWRVTSARNTAASA